MSPFESNTDLFEPMLLIGLGGTGLKAVRTIMLYAAEPENAGIPFNASLHRMMKQERIAALGIDTDKEDLYSVKTVERAAYPAAFAPLLNSGRLPSTYPDLQSTVFVDTDAMDEAVGLAREAVRRERSGNDDDDDSRPVSDLIRDYLPLSEAQYDALLPPNNTIGRGARQLRALGRIGFLCGMEEISRRIAEAKATLGVDSTGKNLRVFVFCSLAGGTGSGMFLDLAVLLRRLHLPKAVISGFFLLPEAFEGTGVTGRIWSNGYAALRELSVMAKPQHGSAITYNFRSNGTDQKYHVQAGDDSLFDEIVLFNEDAADLDWDPDPNERQQTFIEAAARGMADVALALSRSDLFEANKARQNEMVGKLDRQEGGRRIYHCASATYLLPQARPQLLATLMGDIRERLDGHLQQEREQNVERLPTALLRPDALVRLLLDDPRGEDVPKWRDFAEHGSFGRPIGEILSRHLPALRDQERDFVATSYADLLAHLCPREITASFIQELKKVAKQDRDLAELYDDSPLTIRFSHADLFRTLFDARLATIGAYLNTVESDLEKRHTYLPEIVRQQLFEFATTIEDAAEAGRRDHPMDEGDIPIEAPAELFALRSALQAYPSDQVEWQNTQLRWFSPGPLQQLTKRYVKAINIEVAEAAKAFLSDDETELQRRNSLVYDYIARDFCKGPLEKIRRILQLSDDHRREVQELQHAAQRHIEERFNRAIVTTFERRGYETILAPFDSIAALFRTPDGAREEHLVQREHQRQALRTDFRDWCALRRHAIATVGESGDFIGEIASTMIAREDEPTSRDAPILDAMVTVCGDQWLNRVEIDIATHRGPLGDLRAVMISTLNEISTQAGTLLDYLLERPEFDLARLGGEEGIKKSLDLCRLSVFTPGKGLGESSEKHVTAALPLLHRTRNHSDSTPEGQILDLISRSFDRAPRATSQRSSLPVVLHEQRFHAAYQIKRIERYHRHYSSLDPDERPLYHTLKEAPHFPDLLLPQAVVEQRAIDATWRCERHDSDAIEHALSVETCGICLEEYKQGRRRYQDVSRRNADDGLYIPGTGELDEERGNLRGDKLIKVPGELVEFFWKGIPYVKRYGNGSGFPGLLSSWKFREPIDQGRDHDDQPLHFTFPAVPQGNGGAWEWVVRNPEIGSRFSRASAPKVPLCECFHCGFPIDLDEDARQVPQTCPRCRRTLRHCFYCSDNDGLLFEPMALSDSTDDRCPRCTNWLKDPIHE